MVQAQRFLEKRIANAGGPAPPQVYFKVLEAGLGHVVQAKDYLKAQLTVTVNISEFIDLELEAEVDSVSRGPYSSELVDLLCLFRGTMSIGCLNKTV